MKYRHRTILFCAAILLGLCIAPGILYAQGPLIPCSGIEGVPGSVESGLGLTHCTTCDFFKLFSNILNFISLYIIPPLAVVLIAWAGLLYLTSGAVNQTAKARKILIATVLGALFSYASFIILYTFLTVLSGGEVTAEKYFKITATGFSIQCTIAAAPLSSCAPGTEIVSGIDVCATGTQEWVNFQLNNPGEGQSLKGVRTNRACVNLNAYDQFISAAANQAGLSAERIKAIIAKESGGVITATSRDNDGKSSYGIMQVRPETARDVIPELKGKSDTEVRDWLFVPENSIRAGVFTYAKRLRENNNSHDLAAAAYNGGPVANNPSVNCPGMRRWQCEWDSNGCYQTGRTDCRRNTGYNVTRDYVPSINVLEQQYRNRACL